jgi:hypothetical protein
MDDTNGRKQQVTAEQERMLKIVAKVAARRLTPIETHSICVLLSMAFGRGTLPSRTFAWHVNEVRSALGLPQVTQAAAGNPTIEEKMNILRSALEIWTRRLMPSCSKYCFCLRCMLQRSRASPIRKGTTTVVTRRPNYPFCGKAA